MDIHQDNDPTCVIKMLDDFRSGTVLNRRSSLAVGNRPQLSFGLGRSTQICLPNSTTRPMKLNFDETFTQGQEESNPHKRVKLGDDSIDSTTSETSKNNESSVIASPWEARRIKAELVEARTQYASLETRFNQLNALRRETELLFEQEKKALQQSMERDRNSVRELEMRLKTVRKREAEAREELAQCQSSLKQEQLTLEEKCQELQMENIQLKDRLTEVKTAYVQSSGASDRHLAGIESEAAIVKSELLVSKKQVEDLTTEIRELRLELRKWEEDKAKLIAANQKIKEFEYEQGNYKEAADLVQAQQSKLLRVSELEREIAALKDENKNLRQATSNTLYLEDLVEDMRAKLVSLEEREKENISLRVELGMAQTRLEEWNNLSRLVIGQKASTPSPIALRRQIEGLQQRELQLIAENAQLESSLKTLKEAHNETVKLAETTQAQVNRLKTTIEQHASTLRRLRKQNALITWERNDLRNLVDSCQKEVTMSSTFTTDSQQNSRMEALEKLAEGYKKRMEQLEAEPALAVVDTQGLTSPQNADRIEKLTAEKNALLSEKEALAKEVEELRIQMEYRALKGDFDQRTTKVLHFKMNPTAEAMDKHVDELSKYKEEALKLRERVKLLESGQTHDLTLAVNDKVLENTEELKKRIKSIERQNQRLCEAFKTKSSEFREAVYTLFGYKLDALSNKMFRLSSLYAEAPDEHLLFKMSQNGDMELLESPFSATLSELIDIHLHHHGSIPVFLSAITMNLFQTQTQSRVETG